MAYSCTRGLGAYGATVDDGSKSSDHVLNFDSQNLYAINFIFVPVSYFNVLEIQSS